MLFPLLLRLLKKHSLEFTPSLQPTTVVFCFLPLRTPLLLKTNRPGYLQGFGQPPVSSEMWLSIPRNQKIILDPKVPITCSVGKQVNEWMERLLTVLPATGTPGHYALSIIMRLSIPTTSGSSGNSFSSLLTHPKSQRWSHWTQDPSSLTLPCPHVGLGDTVPLLSPVYMPLYHIDTSKSCSPRGFQ